MNNIFTYLLRGVAPMLFLFIACSGEFLEPKPQKSMVILETVNDVEALLDNAVIMNRTDYFKLISDGDLYFTDEKLLAAAELQRNLYLWKKDYDLTGRNTGVWDLPYQQVFYANTAMETLASLKKKVGTTDYWNEIYGRALFFRAWAHYNLLQDFAEGFDIEATYQVGVPVIKDSYFPKEVRRAGIKEVYDFILQDLDQASILLPQITDIKTRPSLQAVYALQARVYQNLQDYKAALRSVEKALAIGSTLLDYNLLSFTGALPFSEYDFSTHPEVVFFTNSNAPFVAMNGVEAEERLYLSYDDTDIRKQAFYNADKLYTGTYSGNALYQFTGLAIDELYLLKAECLAHLDQEQEAVNSVNELLAFRYRHGAPIAPPPNGKVLEWLLDERQKELVGRGTRWTDLKRLNREGAKQIELHRTYRGEVFTLTANDSRYVFDIPQDEQDISGLEPNKR